MIDSSCSPRYFGHLTHNKPRAFPESAASQAVAMGSTLPPFFPCRRLVGALLGLGSQSHLDSVGQPEASPHRSATRSLARAPCAPRPPIFFSLPLCCYPIPSTPNSPHSALHPRQSTHGLYGRDDRRQQAATPISDLRWAQVARHVQGPRYPRCRLHQLI